MKKLSQTPRAKAMRKLRREETPEQKRLRNRMNYLARQLSYLNYVCQTDRQRSIPERKAMNRELFKVKNAYRVSIGKSPLHRKNKEA